MRQVFLWMSRNRWLKERLPRLRFVKRAVRRFMPGEDAASALDAADRFRADGIGVLFTRLGENLLHIGEADAVAEHYLGVFDEIERRALDGEVSVKLTQLGFDLDPERAYAHCRRLAARAATLGTDLWIDMEGSDYTEATVAFYERLKLEHPNVALAIQAYLRRTAADVERLLPLEPGFRLVKGAYAEPASVAFQKRSEVDASFVSLTMAMLQAKAAGRKVRVALGTHDTALIDRITEQARGLGLGPADIEVQMLYGIREDEQRRLARAGYPVRDLIAYGEHWYPWYMRRLAERPANVLFALRQMLP